MTRVLVCGGRDFYSSSVAYRGLDEAHMHRRFTLVIQGGAAGADAIAEEWAKMRGINCDTYTADWREGRSAGPRRNQRMLAEGKPDLVIAFPGGRGTADMISRARKAGVEVIEPIKEAGRKVS